jgi:hypothetical protein
VHWYISVRLLHIMYTVFKICKYLVMKYNLVTSKQYIQCRKYTYNKIL